MSLFHTEGGGAGGKGGQPNPDVTVVCDPHNPKKIQTAIEFSVD